METSNLDGYDRLVEDVPEVFNTLEPRQREVRTSSGVPYLMRIQPYRTAENVIEGAVMTFVDISEIQRLRETLRAVHDRLCTEIVTTVRELMLVLDEALRVVLANRAFLAGFHVSEEETEGCLVFELGNGQWDIPALRRLLDEVLPGNNSFEDFEVTHDFEQIVRRTLVLSARVLIGDERASERILLAFEDATGPEAVVE